MEKKICAKVKFATQKFADDYIKKLKQTSTRDKVPMRSYLCAFCGAWHLTGRASYEETKNAELLKIIADQKKEIEAQKALIEMWLLAESKEQRAKIRTETRKDELVKMWKQKAFDRNKIIDRLRKDNSELITKMNGLQTKLNNIDIR